MMSWPRRRRSSPEGSRALAGAASGAARPGEVIETAFDPPVGRPLLYRLSREVTKDDTTVSDLGQPGDHFLRRAGLSNEGARARRRNERTDAARRASSPPDARVPAAVRAADRRQRPDRGNRRMPTAIGPKSFAAPGNWSQRRARRQEAPDSPAAELVTGMLQRYARRKGGWRC